MDKPIEKPKCQHVKTYVAVRHVSGIQLVKCSECGQVVN
jgi:transcription elongation factor Elf1